MFSSFDLLMHQTKTIYKTCVDDQVTMGKILFKAFVSKQGQTDNWHHAIIKAHLWTFCAQVSKKKLNEDINFYLLKIVYNNYAPIIMTYFICNIYMFNIIHLTIN
jgi:hypothetical protein